MNSVLVLYCAVHSLTIFHQSTASVATGSSQTEICGIHNITNVLPGVKDPGLAHWLCSCGTQSQRLSEDSDTEYYYSDISKNTCYADYYSGDSYIGSVVLCFNSSHNMLECEQAFVINFQDGNVTGEYVVLLAFYYPLNGATTPSWNFTCTHGTPPPSSTTHPTPSNTVTTTRPTSTHQSIPTSKVSSQQSISLTPKVTTDASDAYQQTNSKAWLTGVIAGSVVGGVVFIIIIVTVIVTIWMCQRRKTNTTRHIRTQLGSSPNRGDNQNPYDIDRSVVSRENSSVNAGEPVIYNVISTENPMPVGESGDLSHDYETLRSMKHDYDNIGFSTEPAHANSDSARPTSVTLIENQLYTT